MFDQATMKVHEKMAHCDRVGLCKQHVPAYDAVHSLIPSLSTDIFDRS